MTNRTPTHRHLNRSMPSALSMGDSPEMGPHVPKITQRGYGRAETRTWDAGNESGAHMFCTYCVWCPLTLHINSIFSQTRKETWSPRVHQALNPGSPDAKAHTLSTGLLLQWKCF